MKVRTSETDPIRLDCLPAGLVPAPGRLGLTFAPGKKVPGLDGVWRRDLRLDLARLREVYGVGAIVNLLEDHELRRFGMEGYHDGIRAFGFELRAFPIVDGGVPGDVDGARDVVGWILERLGAGTNVAVHCRGGLGRTGLVTACCLVAVGAAPDVALREVRAARPGAVENGAQEAFVEDFARRGVARRSSWKTQAMPEARARLEVGKRFTPGEVLHLRLGRLPREMEDKWFVFVEDDWIYLHRSWTGYCIYSARLAQRGEGYEIAEAWVNREREQYQCVDDQVDRRTLVNLIDGLVLNRR